MITIQSFFDDETSTLTYLIFDPKSLDAVIIDPVLDYDPHGSKISTTSADEAIDFIKQNELKLHFILETHAHADHLSGSQIIKAAFGDAKTAIGEGITKVQAIFKHVFGLPDDFATDGSQFDLLLKDDQTIHAGTLNIHIINTPGHTPACVAYHIEDTIFTGDTLFMPDVGAGRCDFPGGSARDLYDSIQRLYKLDDATRVFVGHDYPKNRPFAFETTIETQKASNVALPIHRDRDEFIQWRNQRDSGLRAPRLLFQSVQVNVDAGALPKPKDNEDVGYLKIPINVFRPAPTPEDMSIDSI